MVEIELIAGGNRDIVITADEAKSILHRFISTVTSQPNAPVTTLNMSCRSWPPEALEVFRQFFMQMVKPTVKVLQLDDIIANQKTDDGLKSLHFFGEVFAGAPMLDEVDLSENAIGSRGIEMLQLLLNTGSVKKLSFYKCGLSAAVAKTLSTTLQPRVLNQLTVLSLSENKFGSQGANIIGRLLGNCGSLQELTYSGNRVSDGEGDGTRNFCEGISRLSNLRVLEIGELNIRDASLAYLLCDALSSSPGIEKLSFTDCELGNSNLKLLLEALHSSAITRHQYRTRSRSVFHGVPIRVGNLKKFDLSGNDLDVSGARSLAMFFENTQALDSLEELVLDNNELGDLGVEALASALSKAGRLRSLSLVGTEMTDDGAHTLINIRFKNLQKIDVSDNDIPSNFVNLFRAVNHPFGNAYPSIDVVVDEEADDEEVNELTEIMAVANIWG